MSFTFNQAYMDRLQLLKDCIAMKPTKRVPLNSLFYWWKIFDSDKGYKLSECLRDYDKMESVVREFHERYGFDVYNELGTRVMFTPFDELGGRFMEVNDEAESVQYTEHAPMQGDEYPQFKSERRKLYYTMFLRRFPEATYGQMVRAIKKYQEYGAFVTRMNKIFVEEYSSPAMCNLDNTGGTLFAPFDDFFQFYRGVAGASLDMRKHKTEMRDAMDALFYEETLPKLERQLANDNSSYAVDCRIGFLGHSVLNPKQFDEIYWPYIDTMIKKIVAAGKTVCLATQSFITRFADHFQDIPKGNAFMQFELDDPRELRRLLPNMALAGGMRATTMGYATAQECVDEIHALIDDMGPGFMLCQDKFVAYRNDCKRENLLAVCDFVHNYDPKY